MNDSYTKPINTYDSIEEIDKHIAELWMRIRECVGTLYPSIMRERIDRLWDRREALKYEQQRS